MCHGSALRPVHVVAPVAEPTGGTQSSRRASLLAALERHDAGDEAEARDLARMLELARGAGDPFSRAHFVPGHFTASAFVLSPDGEALLLIYSRKFERWLQPGGHVDPSDESVAAAAVREVLEETGVMVQSPKSKVQGRGSETLDVGPWTLNLFDLDIHPIPANRAKGEPGHEHFDVRFLFRAQGWEHEAGAEARECRWVALGEVTEGMTDASVVRGAGKLRNV